MPRKRVSMRKIREVLRLKFGLKLTDRDTAQSCKLSRSTIGEYMQRAREANLTWPLPENLDDHALEALLFKYPSKASTVNPASAGPEASDISANPGTPANPITPDWNAVHTELQRKGVTRLLLWREYKQSQTNGIGYTKFTRDYKTWRSDRGLVMRQIHKAGEKLFVDYAGLTVPITDASSGEVHQAQVFVATLGSSNLTYCEITNSQNLADWLGAHRRALEFIGGCPRVIVPDNLKSGVKNPCTYEPDLNRSYAEFAEHYGVAVIPARVRKPKDKAKVEVHVQIVERDILAPLRNRTFFSLLEAIPPARCVLGSRGEHSGLRVTRSAQQQTVPETRRLKAIRV